MVDSGWHIEDFYKKLIFIYLVNISDFFNELKLHGSQWWNKHLQKWNQCMVSLNNASNQET